MPLIILLLRQVGCVCANRSPKKCRNYTFYVWRAIFGVSLTGVEDGFTVQYFGGFFSSNKNAPAKKEERVLFNTSAEEAG